MTHTNFQVDSILRINIEFLSDTILNQIENLCIMQRNSKSINFSIFKTNIVEYIKEYTKTIIYSLSREHSLPNFNSVPTIDLSNVPESWQRKSKAAYDLQLQLAFICNLNLLKDNASWEDALYTVSYLFTRTPIINEYTICIENIIDQYPNGHFILWEVFADKRFIELEDTGDIRIIQWESLFINKGQFDVSLFNKILQHKELTTRNIYTPSF
jgi:hypothetical protein